MSKHILIADKSTLFAGVTSSILIRAGFDVIVCHDLADAEYALDNFDFLCFIVDTHLGGGSGFDLYAKIKSRYSQPQIIMTSELDTDRQLDDIVSHEVPVLLIKPFPKGELVNTVKMLVTGAGVFGLENYLRPVRFLKKVRLKNSSQMRPALSAVMEHSRKWGFTFFNEMEIELSIQEMVINAIYHSHGFTAEKLTRSPVTLPDEKEVHLRFGCDEHRFGISITDFQGVLSKQRIYETLLYNLRQAQIIEATALDENIDPLDVVIPTGRGLDMVRKLCGEYYFNIQSGKTTEVILLFDSRYDKDDQYSSIKIFEWES